MNIKQQTDTINPERRAFLGAAAGVTAAVVAPGVILHQASAAPGRSR